MKAGSFITRYWWLIVALVIACSSGADSTPSGDDAANNGRGSSTSASTSGDGDATGDAGGSGDLIDTDLIVIGDAGGSGDSTDPDGTAGGLNGDPGDTGEAGGTGDSTSLDGGTSESPDSGTSDGPGDDLDGGTTYDPGPGGGAGGSGSTSDPGLGGTGTTEDPGSGGGNTDDPGSGGGNTDDPGTGGATADPGTGGATEDPGTGGTSSPGLGGATEDPGVGGTDDPGTGGATADGGTGGYSPPDEDCPWVCIPAAIEGVNLLVLNDASPSGADVEGRMYVGHDAVLPGGYAVDAAGTAASTNDYVLVVGNDLTVNGGTVHGSIAFGGEMTGSITVEGSIDNATPVDFEQLTNDMLFWSDTLAETEPNGTVSGGGGLTLTGTDAGINAFEVNASTLASASSLSISVPEGSTVLINVIGTDVSITNMGFSYIGTDSQHVIFNMPEAETVFMSGLSLQGTLLAPRADLTFADGNAEGQTIVYNLVSGGGEYHPYYFEGCPWVCL